MIKYKLKATIPSGSYANIQPEIELEGDDIVALHAEASAHIDKVWAEYGEKPPTKNDNSKGEKKTTFTGEDILYDSLAHKYYSLDGKPLLSGSAYASSVSPKFNKEVMIPKTAKAWGVDEKELGDVWEMNGRVSTEYGSAIHTALEVYHKFSHLGEAVKKYKELEDNYVLPKNPHIREIVQSFVQAFGTDALTEVLVSDVDNLMAGQIDRLAVLDKAKKVCRIGDYKTNYELDDKKILQYQHQLSFYAKILANKGWTVQGIDLYHRSDKWELIGLDVLSVTL